MRLSRWRALPIPLATATRICEHHNGTRGSGLSAVGESGFHKAAVRMLLASASESEEHLKLSTRG